ncbi:MAG: coiled-coil protein [Candidatus Thorarchaeota archaeon]
MLEEALDKEIAQIEDNISQLTESKRTLEKETKKWLTERNRLNDLFQNLKQEIAVLKEKRDKINQEVLELKEKREELKKILYENRDVVDKIFNSLKELKIKIPHGVHRLTKERDEIDWKIQTNSLSIQKENELLERIKEIETNLVEFDHSNKLKQDLHERKKEIESLKNQMDPLRNQQMELSKESDAIQDEITKLYDRAKKFREESNEAHKKYEECLKQLAQIRAEYITQIKKIKELRKKRQDLTESESLKKMESYKKKSEREALEKFKKDKKITLEEFKMIFGKEATQKDND